MKTYIIFILFLFPGSIFAQRTLEATILDGMTGKPIGNAHVYLDGTTIGTTTDSLGRFRLMFRNVINTSLVISHLMYEKMIVTQPFRELPKVIYLEESVNTFDDVVVSAKDISKWKRREMLAVFRKQLLGYDQGALSSRIMNEDDVVLVHDKEKKELRAYAQKPIEIVNHYLKYRILWELIEFKVEYSDKSLSNTEIQHVSIIGTVSFTDIGTSTESLRIRRRDVLLASTRHFFDLLAKGKMQVDYLTQEQVDRVAFNVFRPKGNIIKLHNPDDYFAVHEVPQDPSMKLVTIHPEVKDSVTGNFTVYVLDAKALAKLDQVSTKILTSADYYKKVKEAEQMGYRQSFQSRQRGPVSEYKEKTMQLAAFPDGNYSQITFYTDTFTIDAYGNTNLYKNFRIDYKLARQRLGDLLPLDYEDLPLGIADTNKSRAEAPDSLLTVEDRIRSNFLKQLQNFPQEKLYVHTDKPCYLSGETIWFRVHLADYATHNPTETESRYVYGELFNPVDSLIQRIKVRRDSSGIFQGYFDLPPNLADGDYRLRFYTRYMEQTGEGYFFNRTISVGHSLSTLYHTDAVFNHIDNQTLHAVLKFTQLKDGKPFVPQMLRLVNALGKEAFIPVNRQGIAEFDILPERDLVKNRIYIEYEYNNMLHKQYMAVPCSRGEYDVSFFPEGGAIPADARIRIAFKALQSNGMGEQVTGKVYDANGDTVAMFTSNPLGMGSFSILPKKGGKYTALCRNAFGVKKRFDLPEVDESAVNMKVTLENDRLILQTVHASGSMLPDSLRLLIHCRGILFYNELWDMAKGLSIRKELFPSGVLQLLLVDTNLNPVSERLVFNMNEQDIAKVAISTEKENYGKRELVRTGISVASHDSIPLQGSFSVSVTADRDVLPDTTMNILSELLFASELQGYIESPAWYFVDGRISEIDHLMLTQGWSRYDINAVLEGDIQTPKNSPEVVTGISGRVASGLFLQNNGKDYYLVMSVAGNKENQYAAIAKVENGCFNMIYDEQPNGVSYIMQLVFPSNSIRAKMWLDSVIYPPVRTRLPYRFDAERTGFDTYLKNVGQPYVSDDGELIKYIDEVLITAKRIKGISPLSPGRLQDRIISLEELSKKKTSASTLMQYLMSAPEVDIKRDSNGTLRARYRNGLYHYDYVFVVDGRWWPMYATDEAISQTEKDSKMGYITDDITERAEKTGGQPRKTVVSNNLDRILSIPINKVEEIEIVRAPAPPILLEDFGNIAINDPFLYGVKNPFEHTSTRTNDHQGYLGAILITTKARDGGVNDKGSGRSVKITPLGYQVSRAFYSPVYDTTEQQDQAAVDLRSTIYWNPDVCTNKDGESEISFYAADAESTYTITIEGITQEGVLIRKTGKINRK